ncbi:MAG: hypothetical protein HXY50_11490 [Ignavibacteriaceae bacterium]|nr:hypothetical protein [Ignavibacteriaceae bacterium]
MPAPAILFLFGLLSQVISAYLAKEPDYLKEYQDALEKKNTQNNVWKIDSENSLRDLSIHQLIKHLRSIYEKLVLIKTFIYLIVVIMLASMPFFIMNDPVQFMNSAIYSFLLLFIAFSLAMLLLTMFCSMFSWLIKSRPQL